MKYKLEIKPAIPPGERHKIEDALKSLGFDIHGGGMHTDLSACDITFSGETVDHLFQMKKVGDG